jgi:hypothetical protein
MEIPVDWPGFAGFRITNRGRSHRFQKRPDSRHHHPLQGDRSALRDPRSSGLHDAEPVAYWQINRMEPDIWRLTGGSCNATAGNTTPPGRIDERLIVGEFW